MQAMGKNDLALINRQVSALTATPALKLSKADARLALAIMWDYETWDELTDALGESTASTNGAFAVGPTDLLKAAPDLDGSEKTGYVVRQIGRLINSMARFPELSERVGVVIPTLYGYDSMADIASDIPSASPEQPAIISNDLIIQSRRNLLNVFTGSRSGGITLISGSDLDSPTAFALDASLKLSDKQSIKVVASEAFAQTLDFPTAAGWKLQTFASLSSALSAIISNLQHESKAVFILSLRGFSDTSVLTELMSELQDSIHIGEGNRVILDTGPLSTVPPGVWRSTDYQVLLQGALDYYNGATNHLKLKENDVSQVTGFVARDEERFSFYLLRDRRDGFLVSSLEPIMDEAPPQACSA